MRKRGAFAGLAPAVLVAALFVLSGSAAASPDIAAGLAAVVILAVSAGWVVGPMAHGSFRSDLTALVAYCLVGAVSYLAIGLAGMASAEIGSGGVPDAGALLGLLAGRLAYGLLYLPFWAAVASPFALAWVIALRLLRGRVFGYELPEVMQSQQAMLPSVPQAIRPGRIGLVAAALVVGYGLFVALVPLIEQDRGPTPPWSPYRPIALFGLFTVPAVVAAIGAVRGVRSLLIAAGVVCLLQAYIAFSGITIGFVVPAIVLLWLGAAERWSAEEPPASRTALLAGVAVIGLTIAAWISLFALAEDRCWVASQASDGTVTYMVVPATNTMTMGPGLVAGGCDGGTMTVQGIGVSAVLAIGAMAFAAVAAFGGRKADTA